MTNQHEDLRAKLIEELDAILPNGVIHPVMRKIDSFLAERDKAIVEIIEGLKKEQVSQFGQIAISHEINGYNQALDDILQALT